MKEEEASAADAIIFRSDREVCSLNKGSFMSRYSILPADALDKRCAWTSSDESVAAVDGTGRVRFTGTGTAVITATLKSGESASYELCIVDENTLPEDLVLNTDRIELPVGNNEQIVYTVLPDTAVAEDIWFQTDDSEIAAIDPAGIVTGLKAGTTKASVEIKYYDEAGNYAGIAKSFTVVVFGGEDAEPDPGTPEETDPETLSETPKDPGKPKEPGAPENDHDRDSEHGHGESGGDKPGGDHNGNSDGKYKDTTDTGDRSNLELWILLAAVAIAGIGGVLLAGWYRRKH